MTVYDSVDQIPLTFQRMLNGAPVSGLTVTVVVKDATTGTVIRSSVSCPEVVASSGIYTYNWSHGLTQPTSCLAIYTVNGKQFSEAFEVVANEGGGRAV